MPERPSLPSRLWTLPRHGLVAAIRLYQKTASPVLPALLGNGAGCRFAPTCSHYAVEAVRTRGVVVGVALAAWRLLRCTPLTSGGYDPVPARRPVCLRISA